MTEHTTDEPGRVRDLPEQGGEDDYVVVFDGVSKRFTQGGQEVWATKDLNLKVRRGELVAVIGQTGCGKSTAFNMLLGLFPPTTGEVLVAGRKPYEDFDSYRGEVAVVFQDPRLLPWRTAIDNVALGLEYLGVDKRTRHATAREWLQRLGLAGSEEAYPYQLSGGMKQRVSIARCFAVDPEIILCDESFSALDEVTADTLREEFRVLVHEYGKTGLFITHSIEEALTVGERVLVFRAPGHVAAEFAGTDDLDAQTLADYRRKVREAMVVGSDEARGGEDGDTVPEGANRDH